MRLARKNEAALLQKMRLRLARYRNVEDDHRADYTVGCVLLQQPFFLEERDWIPAPVDWSRNISSWQGLRWQDRRGASALGNTTPEAHPGDVDGASPVIG
jgi:hypothetical protein